jgi:hypothetical protein
MFRAEAAGSSAVVPRASTPGARASNVPTHATVKPPHRVDVIIMLLTQYSVEEQRQEYKPGFRELDPALPSW